MADAICARVERPATTGQLTFTRESRFSPSGVGDTVGIGSCGTPSGRDRLVRYNRPIPLKSRPTHLPSNCLSRVKVNSSLLGVEHDMCIGSCSRRFAPGVTGPRNLVHGSE